MPSGKVFLNYRRDDSEGYVGRLYDHLSRRFPGRIFRDVTELRPGEDFVDALEREGLSCQVLLAVIGRRWLTIADASGHRRLDDPNDILRQEIAHALQRNVLVMPVLVGGANMPAIDDLPAELARLGRRQALPITELDFEHDIERLFRALEQALGEPEEKPPSPQPNENELNGLLSRARSAIAVQDWNTAIPALQSALALDSANAEAAGQLQFVLRQQQLAALFGKGQILYQNKDFKGALACFQQVRVLGGNYNDVDALIALVQQSVHSRERRLFRRLLWIGGAVLATLAFFAIIGILTEKDGPKSNVPIVGGSHTMPNAIVQPAENAGQEEQSKPSVPIVDEPNAAPSANSRSNTWSNLPRRAPSGSHITLRYLGDQLGGCILRVNFNIGGRVIVPNSNPYYVSDVPEGNQNYVTTGAVVCPLATYQAYGQGSVFIHEDSIFNIVWAMNSYTTCAMTLVPVQ